MRDRSVFGTTVCVLVVAVLVGCSSKAKPKDDVQPGGGTASLSSVSPSPTTSPSLVSPFEDDPAVKALRAWAVQLAKTVNSGKVTDAALDALMTTTVKAGIQRINGEAVGLYYPGPLPFSPIQITKQAIAQHNVNICIVSNGFAQDPKTHKAIGERKVRAVDAGADLVNGQWLVSGYYDGNFSCDGVNVPEPTW